MWRIKKGYGVKKITEIWVRGGGRSVAKENIWAGGGVMIGEMQAEGNTPAMTVRGVGRWISLITHSKLFVTSRSG